MQARLGVRMAVPGPRPSWCGRFNDCVTSWRAASGRLPTRSCQLERYAADLRETFKEERARSQQLRRSYVATVRALSNSVEARDAYTGKHAERVPPTAWRSPGRSSCRGSPARGRVRVPAARHRQGRDPRRDPLQAGPADRRGAGGDGAPPGDRRGDRRANRVPRRGHARSCAPTTSAGTATATPIAWPARRSRWPRACLRSPTCSTRSPPTVPTDGLPLRVAREMIDADAGTQFDPRSSRRSRRFPTRSFSGIASEIADDAVRPRSSTTIPFIRKLIATTLEDVAEFRPDEAPDGVEAARGRTPRAAARSSSSTSTCRALDGIEACRRAARGGPTTQGSDDRDADRRQRRRASSARPRRRAPISS